MREDKLVFAQLTEHLPWSEFSRCVRRYHCRHPTKSLSHWSQLLCMLFAQLTLRSSLRDVITCLRSQSQKLYRAGFRQPVARSTLADANERRDFRIFRDFALHLIEHARRLYAGDSMGVEFDGAIYAIDSSTVDLCLSLFEWAPASKGRAGVKLHTLLDLRGNIPTVVDVTGSRTSDLAFLDRLSLEAGSIYIMDRGYMHAARLMRFNHSGAFFVVRAVKDLQYRVVQSQPLDEAAAGVLSDQHVLLTGQHTHRDYPIVLRRIDFFDTANDKRLIFLTNQFGLPASHVAQLYKSRWQIELFFKCIKQHLHIKSFIGTSENAVKIQIWTALSAYVLVAIVKKRMQCTASLHEMFQVLSLTLFETTPLSQLLAYRAENSEIAANAQISLFGTNAGQ